MSDDRVTLLEIAHRDGAETLVFLAPDGTVQSYSGTRDKGRILGGSFHFECNVCGVPFRDHAGKHCSIRDRWRAPDPEPEPEAIEERSGWLAAARAWIQGA